MAFQLGMTVDLCMAYLLVLILMTLTLVQGHSGSANANKSALNYLENKQATSITLATTVGHYLRDLEFENVYINNIWIDHLVILGLFAFLFYFIGVRGGGGGRYCSA